MDKIERFPKATTCDLSRIWNRFATTNRNIRCGDPLHYIESRSRINKNSREFLWYSRNLSDDSYMISGANTSKKINLNILESNFRILQTFVWFNIYKFINFHCLEKFYDSKRESSIHIEVLQRINVERFIITRILDTIVGSIIEPGKQSGTGATYYSERSWLKKLAAATVPPLHRRL